MARGVKRVILKDLPEELAYLRHIAEGANPGYVCFLISEDLELVKIGASNRWDGHAVNVDERIREIENAAAVIAINRRTVFVALALGKGNTETEIHRRFAAYKVAGEWYMYIDDLKEFVDEVTLLVEQFDRQETDPSQAATATPWRRLDTPAKPPTRKFVRLIAQFEPAP